MLSKYVRINNGLETVRKSIKADKSYTFLPIGLQSPPSLEKENQIGEKFERSGSYVALK